MEIKLVNCMVVTGYSAAEAKAAAAFYNSEEEVAKRRAEYYAKINLAASKFVQEMLDKIKTRADAGSNGMIFDVRPANYGLTATIMIDKMIDAGCDALRAMGYEVNDFSPNSSSWYNKSGKYGTMYVHWR